MPRVWQTELELGFFRNCMYKGKRRPMSHHFPRPGIHLLTSSKDREAVSRAIMQAFSIYMLTHSCSSNHSKPRPPSPRCFGRDPPASLPALTAPESRQPPSPRAPGGLGSVRFPTCTVKRGALLITVMMGTSRNKTIRERLKVVSKKSCSGL